MTATAVLSDCGRHRYRLTRPVGSAAELKLGRVLYVMLNPSTADATADDATIRKCRGFAFRWGYSELEVVNLFSFRATKPRDLWIAGERNTSVSDLHIMEAAARADRIVLAWGHQPKATERALAVERLLRDAVYPACPLACIGGPTTSTATGTVFPRHPVMIAYELPLIEWPRRAA